MTGHRRGFAARGGRRLSGRVMRWLLAAVALVQPAAALAQSGASPPSSQRVSVTLSCGSVGAEFEVCREGAAAWAARTGHRVTIIPAPTSSTERLSHYRALLATTTPDIDVYQIDVVWTGLLAPELLDLGPFAGGSERAHFDHIRRNNTIDGRLVALPWFTDAGLLYYRKDLLDKARAPVPRSCQELADIAERIQRAERAVGREGMWGLVFQGRASEGLTAVALEWIAGHGGGRIVEADGRVSVDNPGAVAAVVRAASWVGRIAPRGVTNYAEEEARRVFQSGNAVFMRNWPYAWALLQAPDSPVRGLVGVARLPSQGDTDRVSATRAALAGSQAVAAAQPLPLPDDPTGVLSGGTLGGWQLAVSRRSRHPREAADLALHMTGRAEQKRRAIAASFAPTYPELYRDPEVLAAVPFFAAFADSVAETIVRPSAVTRDRYPEVSQAIFTRVHAALTGTLDPRDAVSALARDLEDLRAEGW